MNPVLHAIGWTLLHFVWLGAVCGALLKIALLGAAKASPSHRYGLACAAMFVMLCAIAVTFWFQFSIRDTQFESSARLPYETASEIFPAAARGNAVTIYTTNSAIEQQFDEALPYILLGWSGGVVLLSLRLIGAWGYAQTLKFRGIEAACEAHRRLMELAANRMGVHRPVWLYVSSKANVPTLIGWLRPVVLLPAAAVTRLTPDELEAILLHELAHVRRHDYLVNLCQSAIEVVLFYHPAVWWVSAQIRREREDACDNLVVDCPTDPVVYTKALLVLEEMRGRSHAPALGATDGDLVRRVRRIASGSRGPARPALPAVVFLACFMAIGMTLPAPTAATGETERTIVEPTSDQTGGDGLAHMLTLSLGETTVGATLEAIASAASLTFDTPTNALARPVHIDVSNTPAHIVLEQLFLRQQLAWKADASERRIHLSWWEDDGPPEQLRVITNDTIKAWQVLFAKKHSLIDFSVNGISCSEALDRISRMTDIEFVIPDGVADAPVICRLTKARVIDVVEALVNPHGYTTEYDDSGRVLIVSSN